MRRRTEVVEQPTGIFIEDSQTLHSSIRHNTAKQYKQQNSPEACPFRLFILLAACGCHTLLCAHQVSLTWHVQANIRFPGILFISDGDQISLGKLNMVKNVSLQGVDEINMVRPVATSSNWSFASSGVFLISLMIHTYLPLHLLRDKDHNYGLPFHTEVGWLSRGAVLRRFFNLRVEIEQFMEKNFLNVFIWRTNVINNLL